MLTGPPLPRSSSSSSPRTMASIPRRWEEAAAFISDRSSAAPAPPVTVVCGPGNSGKSTFSRLLLHTLLKRFERVGYLDTDVGQPEFTAPGCLSLHIIDKLNPDMTVLCLKNPERCFFYGDINSQRDATVYLNNILSLYDYFDEEYYQSSGIAGPKQSILPLVVNTSGWVKGAGYDLLVKMLKHISPTHVVQLCIPAESKNLPRGKFWLEGNDKGSSDLIELSALQVSSSISVSRKDAHTVRDIRIISYFRQCLPRELHISSFKELTHSFACVCPYKLPFSKVKIVHLHCQDYTSENYEGLNSTVVGLAISSCISDSSERPTPWCVGLGIVRAVDASRDVLFAITPTPLHILENVDIILQGFVEVPSQLQVCGSPYKSTPLNGYSEV